ncbi:DUF4011 domain-containing protein [Aquipuribacter nitratireducens]|uniref:DUF4011 domain-containing protein n=1 Tax=Aquipuribacter nitratireducens TaxID=650104 RepID=A0ABW0GJR3_9MICO
MLGNTGSPVTVTTQCTPVVSYAMAHNGIPVVDEVSLTSTVDLRGAELDVAISDESGVLTRTCRSIVDLAAGARTVVDDVRLQLDPARMKDVAERRPGRLTARLMADGELVAEVSEDLLVLPARHWLARPAQLSFELLPAFVMPNDPAVTALVAEAGDLLKARTGSSSIQGYQSGAERVDAIAEAVFDAARARAIRYAEPPASWGSVGQLVRTPREVLEGRLGTCLDTVVVLAAALEQAGIRPLLWVVQGHAFLGYWRTEDALVNIAHTDVSDVVNLIDVGRVRLVETTMVTDGERARSFAETHRPPFARYLTGDLEEVLAVVDVYTARRSGVVPLPAVAQHATGEVTVVEYVPAVHSSPPAAVPLPRHQTSSGTMSTAPVPPRVAQWKNALLDLSLRNRLINFTDRSGIALAVPDGELGRVEDLLHGSGALSLWPSDGVDHIAEARGIRFGRDLPQDQLAELLHSKRAVFSDVSGGSYATRMRSLAYKARTIVEETGANNLYLALGMLAWEWEGKPLRSPLVLVPVTLRSATRQHAYRIELDESGTSTPNYCLLEKLGQLGVHIPGLADPALDDAGSDLDAALHAVRVAVAEAGRPWRVETTAHLGILQFAKFRLWKDLDEHWDTMIANPLVSHLVHTPTEPFVDPVEGEVTTDLDELAAECPISADASQLRAIADALAGKTLVLEGPPGTGKSQTITNLLSRAIAGGRRVLFVAEKRAALDVVQKRLDAVGMGPFSLDLHDKGSKPAQVRAQILAALEHAVDVDAHGLAASEEDLRTSRRHLTRYATRLHETNPAGHSMYSAHAAQLALGDGSVLEVPPRVLARGEDAVHAIRHRLGLLPDVADPARPAALHPWGFVRCTTLADGQAERIGRSVRAVDTALDRLAVAGPLARAVAEVRGLDDLDTLVGLAGATSVTLQDLDSTQQPAWDSSNEALAREIGAFVAATHPGLDVVTPAAMDLPLADIHGQAQAAAASGFWGRKKRLRAVAEQLSPVLRPGAAVRPKDLVALTGALLQVQGAVRGLADQAGRVPGVAVPQGWNPLTEEGRGLLERQVQWLRWAGRSIARRDGAATGFTDAVRAWLDQRGPGDPDTATRLTALRDAVAELLAACDVDDISLATWSDELSFVRAWDRTRASRDAADEQLLPVRRWVALLAELAALRSEGLDEAARALEVGAVPADEAVKAFDRGVARTSLVERRAAAGLDAFDAVAHERSIRRFVTASESVRDLMVQELPRRAVDSRSFDPRTGHGQVGALQRELNKQRRGLGVRALLQQYGALITQVMPCVLVSPDSLARFFPVQAELFDLVVFDEASQIRVADAIGAMGRARSVVVVGDSKQMPPTSFAEAGISDDEDAVPDGLLAVEDEESILSEAVQARVPQQWLSWHYRSQDESLISFSNQHYYDQRLSSFPAPRSGDADPGPRGHGISLVRVDGHFNRTGKGKLLRTNPVEAEAVVEEIRRRFDASPDGTHPSVGVVTFNVQQRAYIEALLRDSGDQRFVDALEDPDGLFVKNLENVQGDERDTILFSTAFSVNDKGVLPLNFGPLNRGGGERRLNVAVTRARRQVVVFSSFDPAQLRTEETAAVGIKHLRAYLDLAAAGADETEARRRAGLVDRHRDAIAAALRARGHVVTTEVGLSDFRVDISVARAGEPGRPRLAVLLDGPAWARRQTVGDRDGLPVAVLSRLMGWPAVERVWLPEWVADSDAVVGRLERALAAAEWTTSAPQAPAVRPAAALRSAEPATVRATVDPSVRSVVREQAPAALPGAEPFVAWTPRLVGDRSWLDALPHARATAAVRHVALEVIAAEGPIHEVRLARSVAAAYDLTRLNESRIRSILATVPTELRGGDEPSFFWPQGRDTERWEGFRTSTPDNPRPIEDVPLWEIGNAMRALCVAGFGLEREELLREALACFGGKRLTPGVRERVDSALTHALHAGRLKEQSGVLSSR